MTHQVSIYTSKDLYNQTCVVCGEGYYTETSIYDDWDGLLHCSKCNHEVKRHEQVLNNFN